MTAFRPTSFDLPLSIFMGTAWLSNFYPGWDLNPGPSGLKHGLHLENFVPAKIYFSL